MTTKTNREIDALVAEHVMGLPSIMMGSEKYFLRDTTNKWVGDPKPYSTDIAAAWEVIEKLEEEDLYGGIEKYSDGYRAEFMRHNNESEGRHTDDSAPMSICMAALKAKGVEI